VTLVKVDIVYDPSETPTRASRDGVHCVCTGRWTDPESEGGKQDPTSFCGRNTTMEFAFVDPTHALLHRGWLRICPDCAVAMHRRLVEQTWEGD